MSTLQLSVQGVQDEIKEAKCNAVGKDGALQMRSIDGLVRAVLEHGLND